MRILYLNTDTTDSNELGLLLARRLQIARVEEKLKKQ